MIRRGAVSLLAGFLAGLPAGFPAGFPAGGALAAQETPPQEKGRGTKDRTRAAPRSFAELTARLEAMPGAGRRQLIEAFVARHEKADGAAHRARLLLGQELLRGLDGQAALRQFERVSKGIAGGDPKSRDLRARALYGLAQAAELCGIEQREVGQGALDELVRRYRDLHHARYALAARARLASSSGLRIGQVAPSFKPVLDLEGRSHSSAGRLGRATLLLFVTPEDPDGVARVRSLVAAWRKGGGKADAVLMVVVHHDRRVVREMVKREGFRFAVVHSGRDFLAPIVLQFGVQALPSSFLIGPDGTLLLRGPRPRMLRKAARALR